MSSGDYGRRASKPNSGGKPTTEGTDNTEGKVVGEPRDEAGDGSREGGIGGRAGEGRSIPGRKRITARGAVGGSARGCDGEKKGASEANLEMIKQLMAQRFSDMPAARGARERSQIAAGDDCLAGATGDPACPPQAGN